MTGRSGGVTTVFNSLNVSPRFGRPPMLPAVAGAAARAGFDAVGLDVDAVRAHAVAGLHPAALAEQVEALGLRCAELSLLRISGDAAADGAQLHSVLPLVRALRPQFLQVIITTPDALHTARRTVRASLARAAAALGATATRLALEYAPMLGVRGVVEARELLDAPGLGGVVLCVDTWHVVRGPDTEADLRTLPVDRFGYLQVADCPADPGPDPTSESLHHRCMPGDGAAPLRRIVAALPTPRTELVVSVEVLSETWRNAAIEDAAAAAIAALRRTWPEWGV